MFYYYLKLHISKTVDDVSSTLSKFYYYLKLHISKTILLVVRSNCWFYYYLKLHISKTDDINLGTHNSFITI